MCLCAPTKWLIVLLAVIAVWNAFAPTNTLGWIVGIVAVLVFLSEMFHRRMCYNCWQVEMPEVRKKKRR